jgi:hypothetical protein
MLCQKKTSSVFVVYLTAILNSLNIDILIIVLC